MTIAFTQLFTTQGLLCGGLNEANTWRGTTNVTRQGTLRTQYISSAVYNPLVSPLDTAESAAESSLNTWVGFLASNAQQAIFADVLADRPQTNPTLNSVVTELIRQLNVAGDTVAACPCTETTTAVGSPVGDHNLVFNMYEGQTGNKSDFIVPDTYLIQCSKDQSTGGTAFSETFSLVGKPKNASPLDAEYPSGTGINATLTAVDPATNGGLVTDGGFNNWVSNTPTNWTLGSGVIAGTHVKKSSDDPRASGFSLDLIGDGTVFVKVRQQVAVTASTVYSAQFRVKKILDPGTDWGITLRLVDSSGNPLTGPNSYLNNIESVTCASIAASWANVYSGTFVTPAVLPTTGVFIEIFLHKFGDLTVAAVNTAEGLVDHVSMQTVRPTQFYSGGPTLIIFSGTTAGVVGDARTAAFALASSSMSAFLIRGMDRMLGLASLSVRLNTTTSSPTFANTLVT